MVYRIPRKRVQVKLLILLTLLLAGCAGMKQGAKIRPWTQPVYEKCEVNIVETDLPYGLGMSVYNTNLPTRYDSMSSIRPFVVSKKGKVQDIGSHLVKILYQTGVHFSEFSPDGKLAYLNHIWEEPQHAMWEAAARRLMFSAQHYRADVIQVDLKKLTSKNLTKVEEIGYYNTGTSHIPGTNRLAFSSLIAGENRAFSMNLDGTDKRPMQTSSGFSYGIRTAPDGIKYAFNSNYKLFIGDNETGIEQQISTGCNFNFMPIWSPDSQYVSFFCGASNIGPDLYIVDRNGSNVRKLTDRGGYSGSIPIIDGYDFHHGGSDLVAWYNDSIIYASGANGGTELFSIDIYTGAKERLTFSDFGTLNYYPTLSPDGKYLLFNTNLNKLRNLKYMSLETLEPRKITDFKLGCAAYTIKWKPE